MKQITSLNLEFNNIGAAGATAIAEHLTNLTSLDLLGNKIGAEGAKALLNLRICQSSHRLILDVITSRMMVRRPSQNI